MKTQFFEEFAHNQRLRLRILVGNLWCRPALWIAIPFAFGIATSYSPLGLVLALVLLVACIIAAKRSNSGFRYHIIAGFLAIGFARGWSGQTILNDDLSHLPLPFTATIFGQVASEPQLRDGYAQFLINTEAIELRDRSKQAISGKISVGIGGSDGDFNIDYGDHIIVTGRIEKAEPNRNPGGDRPSIGGASAFMRIRGPGRLKLAGEHGPWNIGKLVGGIRKSLLAQLKKALPTTEAAIASGILIGARTDIPHFIEDEFVLTGTVHILATAGLHVGIIAALFRWFLNLVGFHARVQTCLLILFLVCFGMVAGGRPAAMRAVIMAIFYFGAELFDREPDAPSAIAVAAFLLLALSPDNIVNAGFQLSFCTVMTIAAAISAIRYRDEFEDQLESEPGSRKYFRAAWQHVVGLCLLSTAAQLGSAPIVAEHFNTVSATGVVANLLVVPLLFLIIPLGVTTIVVSYVSLPVAQMLGKFILVPLIAFIEKVVHLVASAPMASLNIQSPGILIITIYYVFLGYLFFTISAQRIGRRSAKIRPSVPVGHAGDA